MTDIFLVRHGETESNRAGLWQGATDSALTATGRQQVKRLAVRLGAMRFDTVVSSDLGRAQSTAAALEREFTARPAWREPDLGVWEGKTSAEVRAMSPDALRMFARGEDVRLGGAERLSEAATRLIAAYRQLVSAVGSEGRALVITHGLAVAVLTGALLGTRRPNPLALPGNTGIVHLMAGELDQLHVHNDTTHLVEPPISHRRGAEIVFIRHAETVGNVAGRWQGQQDGTLTPDGRAQAKRLPAHLPELDVLYTSRLGRARETAQIIGDAVGLEPRVVAGVEELGFGLWEGLTRSEIRERYPDEASRVFDRGEDLRRGGHGETWAELVARVAGSVAMLADRHQHQRVGIVSHGGTTRAFVDEVLALEPNPGRRVAALRNTAWASFAVAAGETRVLDWNIAPHLES